MLSRFMGVLPNVPLLNGAEIGVKEDALLDRFVLNVSILSLSPSGDCSSSASSDKRSKEGCLFVFIDLGLTRGVRVGSIKGRRPLLLLLAGVWFNFIVFSLSCKVLPRLDFCCLGGGDSDEVGCN